MAISSMLAALVIGGSVPTGPQYQDYQTLTAPRRLEELERESPEAAPPPQATKAAPPLANGHPADFPPREYRPVRTDTPPKIDGVLDDPVWQVAPKDNRFVSRGPTVFNQPSADPTTVQLAYDNDNLYVAFTCEYGIKSRERDIEVPENEFYASAFSEFVSVIIDPDHNHTHAYSFIVTPIGYKVDVEIAEAHEGLAIWWSGVDTNYDWHGLWSSAVWRSPDSNTWTVEMAIPWGTLRFGAGDDETTIGINFRRKAMTLTPEGKIWNPMTWTQYPQQDWRSRPAYLGHLVGLSNIHSSQYLYLAPYAAGTANPQGVSPLRLRNMPGLKSVASGYAGMDGTVAFSKSASLDFSINPDFSQVTPDQAQTQTGPFEPIYAENRSFFAQDIQNFSFGEDRVRLFYSRRVGFTGQPGTIGFQEVPILGAEKLFLKTDRNSIGLLNVTLTDPTRYDPSFGQNLTLLRTNHYVPFLDGLDARVGTIVMNEATPSDPSAYRAYGVDWLLPFVDRHLLLAGYAARSDTAGDGGGMLGNASLRWKGDLFSAVGAFTIASPGFQVPYGLIDATGFRQAFGDLQLRIPVDKDLLGTLFIDAQATHRWAWNDTPLMDNETIEVDGQTQAAAFYAVRLQNETDVLLAPLVLLGGSVVVPPGSYTSLTQSVSFQGTGDGRFPLPYLEYTEGGFFGGYQRTGVVGGNIRFHPFLLGAQYAITRYFYDQRVLWGHLINAHLLFRPTPDLQAAIVTSINTLQLLAVVQFIVQYEFGKGSSISLVVNNAQTTVQGWVQNPSPTAALRFTYGFSPF